MKNFKSQNQNSKKRKTNSITSFMNNFSFPKTKQKKSERKFDFCCYCFFFIIVFSDLFILILFFLFSITFSIVLYENSSNNNDNDDWWIEYVFVFSFIRNDDIDIRNIRNNIRYVCFFLSTNQTTLHVQSAHLKNVSSFFYMFFFHSIFPLFDISNIFESNFVSRKKIQI